MYVCMCVCMCVCMAEWVYGRMGVWLRSNKPNIKRYQAHTLLQPQQQTPTVASTGTLTLSINLTVTITITISLTLALKPVRVARTPGVLGGVNVVLAPDANRSRRY